MKIQTKNINLQFKAKIDTATVFEATTMKIFKNEGISGYKKIVNELSSSPIKSVGSRGYAYYAKNIGDKIKEKYPEIAKTTEKIQEIIQANPHIKKDKLYEKIYPLIEPFGNEIDVAI